MDSSLLDQTEKSLSGLQCCHNNFFKLMSSAEFIKILPRSGLCLLSPAAVFVLGFLGWLSGLRRGERSTLSKEQTRQTLVPKGEFTHAAGGLKPQPYLFLTGCNLTLPHPRKVRLGWMEWHCPSFQGGSLQTQQQTCAQTEGYYLLLLLEIIMSDNYIY